MFTVTYSKWNIYMLFAGSESDVSLSEIPNQETTSVMSFRTNNTASTQGASAGGGTGMATYMNGAGGGGHVMLSHQVYTNAQQAPPVGVASQQPPPPQQFGTKVEMVYGLLSMLGTTNKDDMSRTLLAMSCSQDSCIAMRQSGQHSNKPSQHIE